MRPTAVLIHFDELGLKGRSRPFFERRLRRRLDAALRGVVAKKVRADDGRMTVVLDDDTDVTAVTEVLRRVPGIAWYAPVFKVERQVEAFKRAAVELAADDTGSFRVTVKRATKKFPVTSMEVARQMGAAIHLASGRPVNLKQPDHNYQLEISERGAYLYSRREAGLGGLPPGMNGAVALLMSGGADSAIAGVRTMRRGAVIYPVHFFNASVGVAPKAAGTRAEAARGPRVADKAERMAAALSRFQGHLTLTCVDFAPVQAAIHEAVSPRGRTLAYRRLMHEITSHVATRFECAAVVTGDVIGQDAAQTIESLALIYEKSRQPVLTPVAGDRREVLLETARGFDLLATAALPYEDCVHHRAEPRSAADVRPDILEEIRAFDPGDLVDAAVREAERHAFKFGERVVPRKDDAPAEDGAVDERPA